MQGINRPMPSLSGTPAEAGVRGTTVPNAPRISRVSVEPPPKQGCEFMVKKYSESQLESQWNPRRSRGASGDKTQGVLRRSGLSGTPAEAGVRGSEGGPGKPFEGSQWNPRRSRGARTLYAFWWWGQSQSQWNPRRSRGARLRRVLLHTQLDNVSVEPPPKQGCEEIIMNIENREAMSQWNPRRSRGASWPQAQL